MASKKPTCFVIQGYGKKTDYTDGRVLDLDASYEIIKEAVESAGAECVRADEIVHSGTIDVPMYERLLNADLVIADLSTYNVNAAFELGVRYVLKPYSTIVLAEEQFKNPFDLGHVVIRRYKHLGEEVGFQEAKRVIKELKTAIQTLLNAPAIDSPVYTYLPQLQPPLVQKAAVAAAVPTSAATGPAVSAEVSGLVGDDNPSAKLMLDAALEKINASDFMAARALLEEVRKLRPKDSFILQQLALSMYKSEHPSVLEALKNAVLILHELKPETSNDPETMGLWGAIHKRIWEECGDSQSLDESIAAYERGFYLKQDHYNGINLAYLLNLRSVEALKTGNKDEAIADFVIANRVRREVIRFATPLVERLKREESATPSDENRKNEVEINRYWVVASLWEAAIGLDDDNATSTWEAEAKAMNVGEWRQKTREDQGARLRELLTTYKALAGKQS
ncbi:TRAFs-binding domain-containing protein [Methylobacter luteus]|uniref:TRAFs-binding domain-containing protein n=1 Tax=Methylobacter luteus TaxID=415 RepID=UPI000420B3D4|nr:TRAFs-binding domain-containing protein [Methylobacter luteus]